MTARGNEGKVYVLSDVDYDGGMWDIFATFASAAAAVEKEYPGCAEWAYNNGYWSTSFTPPGKYRNKCYFAIDEREVRT